MNIGVFTVIICLCCVQQSSQSHDPFSIFPYLISLFRDYEWDYWDWIRLSNFMKIVSRGRGPIQVDTERPGKLLTYQMEDFVNETKCIDACCNGTLENDFYVDICFAVQMSCYLNATETFLKARGQMADIIDQIGQNSNGNNRAEFTVFLYSDTVDEWNQGWGDASQSRKQALRDMVIQQRDCDCQSRTHDAIDACREKLNGRQVDGNLVPRTIIVFSDGITQHGVHALPQQARLQTVQTVQATKDIHFILPKIVVYPPGVPNPVRTVNGPQIDEGAAYENSLTAIGSASVNHQEVFPNLGLTVPVFHQQDQADCPCCKSDIVLVIDRSNSINEVDLHLMFHFVHDFIKLLQGVVHPDCGARFGVISYCGKVQKHINLNENLLKYQLLNKLARVNTKKRCKYTETPKAIEEATRQLVDYGRPDARKIMVLITDGRTWLNRARHVLDPPTLTIAKADAAKQAGIEILVVGVPNHKDRNDGFDREWKHIGSSPVNCSVIDMQEKNNYRPTFEDLKTTRVYLSHKVCCLDLATRCTGALDPFTQQFCTECEHAFCPIP